MRGPVGSLERTRQERFASLTVAELYEVYVLGERTQAEVAERFGVSLATVTRKIRSCGLDGARNGNAPHRWSYVPDETLRRLYVEERLSLAAIGGGYGVTGTTVGRRLKAMGVELRPRGWRFGRRRKTA